MRPAPRRTPVRPPRWVWLSCHLTKESIQRTSKSACLSCHRTYPQWHITNYGPITSIYTGDGRESFAQCTSTCHPTHPNSHL
jgi:hypothetical protein